jgi:hypothetical protein
MGMSQFELECHPGDAVVIAPVSAQIPCYLTGNFTGNFGILGTPGAMFWQETIVLQPLLEQFPTPTNREIFW